MPPRVPRLNAGRIGASLRRPSPLPDLARARSDADLAAVAAGDAAVLGPVRLLDPVAGEDAAAGERSSAAASADAAGARPSLDALRRTVARIEGRLEASTRLAPAAPAGDASVDAVPAGVPAAPAPADRPADRPAVRRSAPAPARLSLGVPGFDGLFPGGGPLLAATTELRCGETRLGGALTGFVAALLVRIGRLRRGPVLWVREDGAMREAGAAAGLGLVHLGLDPGRLLVVSVREAAEALWAAEEGLGCGGLAAVVAEMHGLPRAFDLTASRRLGLRARESGVPALLVGHAMPEAASAAAVRLSVTPRPSLAVDGFGGGPGFPAWTVAIEKNRDGRTGRVDMEWNSDARGFRELVPLPVPVAAGDPHGPAGAAAAGQVVAHPAAVRRAS